MRYDRRLSRTLHVLLHLEEQQEPVTSTRIGRMLNTNPAFVRRTMAGLRERGWVTASRGSGGGWRLVHPLAEISLLELYEALDSPTLFAMAPSRDAPTCLMEQAANAAVDDALRVADVAFRAALSGVTVADLAADFERRLQADGRTAWVAPETIDVPSEP